MQCPDILSKVPSHEIRIDCHHLSPHSASPVYTHFHQILTTTRTNKSYCSLGQVMVKTSAGQLSFCKLTWHIRCFCAAQCFCYCSRLGIYYCSNKLCQNRSLLSPIYVSGCHWQPKWCLWWWMGNNNFWEAVIIPSSSNNCCHLFSALNCPVPYSFPSHLLHGRSLASLGRTRYVWLMRLYDPACI